MADDKRVKFIHCSTEYYNTLVEQQKLDQYALYFVNSDNPNQDPNSPYIKGTHQIYLGDRLYYPDKHFYTDVNTPTEPTPSEGDFWIKPPTQAGGNYELNVYRNGAWEPVSIASSEELRYKPGWIQHDETTGEFFGEAFNDLDTNKASGKWSHLEGTENEANSGSVATHIEGFQNIATDSSYSHIEGNGNIIEETNGAHLEGQNNSILESDGTHAEGINTQAKYATGSHVEGMAYTEDNFNVPTKVAGSAGSIIYGAHAEGVGTKAMATGAHAEGQAATLKQIGSRGAITRYVRETTASGEASHAEGIATVAAGIGSHAEGVYLEKTTGDIVTRATGVGSHAEGCGTWADGNYSHAEGQSTQANGIVAHSEGSATQAYGDYSHAEGKTTTAFGQAAHAEGTNTLAEGNNSHSEGQNTKATQDGAHAEGYATQATGNNAHAEGQETIASGYSSHAEGMFIEVGNINRGSQAIGIGSHAEGYGTTAQGNGSHSEGYDTHASGTYSHTEGLNTAAYGNASHASGSGTEVWQDNSTVIGQYNTPIKNPSARSYFIVGSGSSNSNRRNAFRVEYNNTYINGTLHQNSADYAEYFEWNDGNKNNKDRRGLFVTLEEDKIRLANKEDDYILGIVSAAPGVTGNGATEEWTDRYLKDIFGVEIKDKNGNSIINPKYNPEQEYVSRKDRSEWAPIGLIGQLVMVDDGTCVPGEYCGPGVNGVATASSAPTNCKVMKRLDANHIKVFLK